jgi:energy-coupling factor transporter ATP-binding protein EcfA2
MNKFSILDNSFSNLYAKDKLHMIESSLDIGGLVKTITSSLKLANEEYINLFDEGLNAYLKDKASKYFTTNTFLHRYEKVEFSKYYYPAKASYDEDIYNFDKIKSVFNAHQYITIVGSAGSGKTTLMKHLFLSSIREEYRIPIILELRKLNNSTQSIYNYIQEDILQLNIKPGNRTLQRALNKGSFLFLLDGFDEIYSTKKEQILINLEKFVDTYPHNDFVLTTRPGSGVERFPRFHDFRICKLDNEDIPKFVSLMLDDEERVRRILDAISDPKNQDYKEYLNNPLLLSMFLLTFENHPEIPKRKSSFYRNVFDTLYSKHDGITKSSFPREKLTSLQKEDFEQILNAFSFISYSEGKYSFTEEYLTDTLKKSAKQRRYSIDDLIYDLNTAISILTQDSLEYQFPHRSMQEYFCAMFINSLPESKKQFAFDKIHDSYNYSSIDGGINFWGLCEEINSDSFIRYGILPLLKEYSRRIDLSSNKKLIISFLDLYEPVFIQHKNDDPDKISVRVPRKANLFNKIIDYKKIYRSIEVYSHFDDNNFNFQDFPKIMELIKFHRRRLDSINLYRNETFQNFLVKTGFVQNIKDKTQKLRNSIQAFEEQLKENNNDLDDFLSN